MDCRERFYKLPWPVEPDTDVSWPPTGKWSSTTDPFQFARRIDGIDKINILYSVILQQSSSYCHPKREIRIKSKTSSVSDGHAAEVSLKPANEGLVSTCLGPSHALYIQLISDHRLLPVPTCSTLVLTISLHLSELDPHQRFGRNSVW